MGKRGGCWTTGRHSQCYTVMKMIFRPLYWISELAFVHMYHSLRLVDLSPVFRKLPWPRPYMAPFVRDSHCMLSVSRSEYSSIGSCTLVEQKKTKKENKNFFFKVPKCYSVFSKQDATTSTTCSYDPHQVCSEWYSYSFMKWIFRFNLLDFCIWESWRIPNNG